MCALSNTREVALTPPTAHLYTCIPTGFLGPDHHPHGHDSIHNHINKKIFDEEATGTAPTAHIAEQKECPAGIGRRHTTHGLNHIGESLTAGGSVPALNTVSRPTCVRWVP